MGITRLCSASALVTAAFLAACDSDPQAVTDQHDHAASFARIGAGKLEGLAKEVRQATSRFSSMNQAAKGGYEQSSGCVGKVDVGGMGFHWVNPALVDDVFDPLNPESLLYAPRSNGDFELVGVEYIVVDIGQPLAPTFDGQPFDVGGGPLIQDHWTLHVWTHRENPDGLFMPFNPTVICS